MVGAVSTVLDLASAVNKIAEIGDSNLTSTLSQLNNTKSITERAKKALFIYPVLFSPGVTEIDLATKISKFLEIQYGIFTIMTVGLNPSVEDGNISNYLNSIATEGYEIDENIKCKIQNVNPDHVEIFYQDYQRENEGIFDPYIAATEAYNPNYRHRKEAFGDYAEKIAKADSAMDDMNKMINSTDDVDKNDFNSKLSDFKDALNDIDHLNEHQQKIYSDFYSTASQFASGRVTQEEAQAKAEMNNAKSSGDKKRYEEAKKEYDKIAKEARENDKFYRETLKAIKDKIDKTPIVDDLDGKNPLDISDETLTGRASIEKYDVIKDLTKANPTMISLKVKIKGYDSDFVIPIGLKASPHFVNQEDLATLLDAAIEDKRVLTRIVRLTSGEISFFKDFLLGLDRIKRDQKLYARFGQHPWYQQFMQRKEARGWKRLGIILSGLFSKLKGITSATSNYLPTASLVLTTDELEKGAKMKYGFLLKHEKILWDILIHLGLLCICIYNPELETCNFYFNGFKKPMLVPLSQMKSDKTDPNAELAKAFNTMLKRGIM